MNKFKITYWKHNKPNPMSKCFEVIDAITKNNAFDIFMNKYSGLYYYIIKIDLV